MALLPVAVFGRGGPVAREGLCVIVVVSPIGLGSASVLSCEVVVDVEVDVAEERLGLHFVVWSCSG